MIGEACVAFSGGGGFPQSCLFLWNIPGLSYYRCFEGVCECFQTQVCASSVSKSVKRRIKEIEEEEGEERINEGGRGGGMLMMPGSLPHV